MGFSSVIVWVLKENDQARKFYEKMGFCETGQSKSEVYHDHVLLNEIRYKINLIQQFEFKPKHPRFKT